MIGVSQFSSEQIEQLKLTVAQGLDLAQTQKYINEELGMPVSYMETRFLIADLGIELFDKHAVLKQAQERDQQAQQNVKDTMVEQVSDMPAAPVGGVQVTQDSIQRPGAVANGQVIFSDGEHSSWYITSEGQLGLDSQTAGYQPSESDIAEFQQALKNLLS